MLKITNYQQTPNFSKLEEEVIKFWDKEQIFARSVQERDPKNTFTFYDGPPFATGLPHYGHILASTTKDVIPRYQTMKGKRVERIWGWDCHGLPIENLIEKDLNLGNKKELEKFGVDKFNEACRSRVLTYRLEWQKVIKRIGRFVDMEHDYKTMDRNYMESVWWVFKKLYEKDLIYRGHKSMHICPRCATPLSNFEVTLGYKDVKDISVTVEFKLKQAELKKHNKLAAYAEDYEIFILAWTTTPWTLPGNVLLAVDPKFDYVLIKGEAAHHLYLVALQRLKEVCESCQVIATFKGQDLLGLTYEALFPYFKNTANAFRIVAGDFLSLKEGTGIVHIAPGFGEDDYKLGQKENIPLLQHVNFEGEFVKEVSDFAGLQVKPKDDPNRTDIEIIKYLAHHDRLFSKKKLTHSYPHCWRCDTPLLNYATDSWFVKVTALKEQLVKNNQKINWHPKHLQEGRFGKWLQNAKDWAISRNRYWGTPLPVWLAKDGEAIVIGSVKELEEKTGQKFPDLHKHYLDQVVIKQNGKLFYKIPEVLDCWFESGSMPYAQGHYPFENKEKFEQSFPAAFISESLDQTRGWFYTLHVLATALTYGKNKAIQVKESTSSFQNVICSGIILAEDGKKMSKRLKNYPEPNSIWEKYGADSLRLYLMSSPVLKAEALNFSEKDVQELRRKVFLIWWNVFSFYKLFASQNLQPLDIKQVNHVLDLWIISKLENLTKKVTYYLDHYNVVAASRMLIAFIPDLSNWYLRLSRDRIKDVNNELVSQVLAYVLKKFSLLFAPIAPFFTEVIFQNISQEADSIHLASWPKAVVKSVNSTLEQDMQLVQKIVELGHAKRKDKQIKVRQPLSKVIIICQQKELSEGLLVLIKQELNVKKVTWTKKDQDLHVDYDFFISKELQEEGEARELIRQIQDLRKAAHLEVDQISEIFCPKIPAKFKEEIEKKTNSKLILGKKLALKNLKKTFDSSKV